MLDELTATDISQHFINDVTQDPNHNYDKLHDHVKALRDKYMPLRYEKFHKHRHKKNQWMTYGILRSIKYRDEIYITYKKSPQNSAEYYTLKNNLRVFNSILKRVIREAKMNYYNDVFEKNKRNIKAIWKTISEIICKSNNQRKILDKIIVDSNAITDPQEICNRFNEFFVGIGPKLANKINTENKKVFSAYITRRILTSFTFTLVNQDEVKMCISSLKTKTSCGIDGISVKFLKFLSPALIKPLSFIINQSLVTGIFPTKLKIAKVLPLFKKEDPTLMDNYRPVSLLPSISKVFEKIVFNQLYKYFQDNKLFYPSQYGFREGHSTEMAALELTDRILQDIDSKYISLAIFMDLSKAFDTLDHTILLNKLNYYGIGGNELNWFSSYLSNRQQYVEINGLSSTLRTLQTGVPQGSILGPLLFLIYMNDIPQASSHFKFILYADDTTLFSTIQFQSTVANIDINQELTRVHDWLAVNRLSLNVKKTKYIVFHAINKATDGLFSELHIDGINIERVTSFNFLGIHFNEHMLLKTHIDTIGCKLAKLSGVLNRLKRYLPEYVLRTLYCSMVQSRLTYGILAWGFYHYRLEKIQNRIIRIISRSKYNAPTRPIFKAFELLTIHDLFSLNCLRFLYNYKNKKLPTYFCELTYTPRSDIHDYDTRYADLIDIESTRTVMAEKCIRVHLGNVMNDTPNIIMEKINTHSIYGFVFSIKRYYLDSYWDKLFIEICPTHKVEYMNMNIYQIVKSWVLVDYVPHFLSSSSSPSPHQYVSIKVRYMSNIFLFSPSNSPMT